MQRMSTHLDVGESNIRCWQFANWNFTSDSNDIHAHLHSKEFRACD